MNRHDVLINGGGLAGLTCAIALSRLNLDVGVIAPTPPQAKAPNGKSSPNNAVGDRRTTALLSHSTTYLDELGLWEQIKPNAAPLEIMRIIDATNRLIRAPQVDFRASEIELGSFGENVTNFDLLKVLNGATSEIETLTLYDDYSSKIDIHEDEVAVKTKGGIELKGQFLIGADGRNSPVRAAANITTRQWNYPQEALVVNLEHTLPHGNVSTEIHTESGPFTLVPMPGNASSLVWVEKPEIAQALAAHSSEALSVLIEKKMQSILGKIKIVGKTQTFPLSGMIADRFGEGRVALIGEAAHVIPPIGAQGFNLGIRDIQSLSKLLGSKTSDGWGRIGNLYHDSRLRDVNLRATSIDLFNRSLLSDFLPTQLLRGLGLFALGNAGPLRRMIMREGVGRSRSG